MREQIEQYLIKRFSDDARILRGRASSLRSGANMPGPDAATSQRMAGACEDVADVLRSIDDIPAHNPRDGMVAVLSALEQRMHAHRSDAQVRSVYAGAISRLREIAEATGERGE